MGILEFDNRYGDDDVIKDENGVIKDDIIRSQISFYPPMDANGHIIQLEDGSMAVTTQGGVLLGKMSFRILTDDSFDITGFKVIPSSYSPETGIKINIDGTYYYQQYNPEENTDKLLLRFTDATASKDADLTNIVLSNGEKNTENPSESTYKEYDLTPTFDKEKNNYNLTLLEYIDTINMTATQSDENATMKIKIPKHDSEGNLVYESDGTTIIYEEKDLGNNVPFGVTLNKLGEPDTKITIEITAEDGVTKNEYEVLIKRPYGTITGSIQLGETLRLSTYYTYNIDLDYIADIKVYNNKEIDWNKLLSGDMTFEDLDLIIPQYQTKSEKTEGKYELLLIPGVYDIYMETIGFTQAVETQITVNEGSTIDLGNHILYEGDLERDGIVDINDLKEATDMLRSQIGDGIYDSKYDFHKKGSVDINDITCVSTNLKERKTITIK